MSAKLIAYSYYAVRYFTDLSALYYWSILYSKNSIDVRSPQLRASKRVSEKRQYLSRKKIEYTLEGK